MCSNVCRCETYITPHVCALWPTASDAHYAAVVYKTSNADYILCQSKRAEAAIQTESVRIGCIQIARHARHMYQ